MQDNCLSQFHLAIQTWFRRTFENLTPPQLMGWPVIARRENTLILAPTGSGKTLAAFLACIDNLLKQLITGHEPKGVYILYVSPLKALNYDIERNLEEPLEGIHKELKAFGITIPEIRVGVRTGDTTPQERQRMIRQPPHILITTPESLHLLLTSQRAREILKTIEFVIVDEIHALCPNKRGTFLSLLLERLKHLTKKNFNRIGLSATQKPLQLIAHFLGGYERKEQNGKVNYVERPVTIIDAGIRKELDLQVISPVADMRELPEDSIWPSIYRQLFELVRTHRSTLIFANNRACVEKITANLNELAGYELALAHHGSVSKDVRRDIENKLKRGELPALVATGTLELGIDMGAIDLVCQVESPGSVSTGLQRVGRAGHLFRAASKGRLLPKMRSDLLEIAGLTRLMVRGKVASIKIPRNCLDIVAQQIVAMVSVDDWNVNELFYCLKCAFPYQDLPRSLYIGVLEMLSGRYPSETFKDLRPRISWDRVNNRLYPLPGSQRLAILSGGAIPETGQYPVYLEDSMVKLGELEEEFVYETRLGDVFQLGTNTWKVVSIESNQVKVIPAPGQPARFPFWKGEYSALPPELGQKLGIFSRELSQKLDHPDCEGWLQRECHLDEAAAWNLKTYFLDQRRKTGTIPTDRTILIESFKDEMGDLRVALLSPYGSRIHFLWRLSILAQIRRDWGIELESLHSDVGILFRFTGHEPDLIRSAMTQITAENLEELIVEELSQSPFFGVRFRQNAGRALLLPRRMPGKRTPLWLLRMRSRDLLEIVSQYDSFPIVMETYRESLQEFLALDELKTLLREIQNNTIKLVYIKTATPSPFCSSLLFNFKAAYMYQYDQPKTRARDDVIQVDRHLLDELFQIEKIAELLSEAAIADVDGRLQAMREGYRARTPTELVELLRRIGDLTDREVAERVHGKPEAFIRELSEEYRILRIQIPNIAEAQRWIAAEYFPLYRDAFTIAESRTDSSQNFRFIGVNPHSDDPSNSIENILPAKLIAERHSQESAQKSIITRFIRSHSLVSIDEIQARYPIATAFIQSIIDEHKNANTLIEIPASPESDSERKRWGFSDTVQRIRRVALAGQRKAIEPCDTSDFIQFLLEWQHLTPASVLEDPDAILTIIEQLQGYPLPYQIWDHEILARRIANYQTDWLDRFISSGEINWFGVPKGQGEGGHIVFAFREDLRHFQGIIPVDDENSEDEEIYPKIKSALQQLGASFVTDIAAETGLPPSVCTTMLWNMIWRGEVTNDSYAVVRASKPPNAYSDKLQVPPTIRQVHGRRLNFRTHQRYRPRMNVGRWTLLKESRESSSLSNEQLEALVYQMLSRYGLLCRELFAMECFSLSWRQVYDVLIRLEWRGEIRRGYFVKGFSGAQFALPNVVDRLVSSRVNPKNRRDTDKEVSRMILLNACDPANLYGAASPLPIAHPMNSEWRFLRHPSNYLILKAGLPLLAIEAQGARLTPLRSLSVDEKVVIAQKLPELLTSNIKSLKIEQWGGQPVRNSEISSYLKQIGFRDEFKMMVLERQF